MLARFIHDEYVGPDEADIRGLFRSIGITKEQPFAPDSRTRAILDKAAATAFKMSHALVTGEIPPGGKIYADMQWINCYLAKDPEFKINGAIDQDQRTVYFTFAFAISAAQAMDVVGKGAKYLTAFRDADGDYLSGNTRYRLHVPPQVPVNNYWSVTLYDVATASGLDNGQRFPSISTFDKPITNADGSTDFYFGPTAPQSHEENWLRTVPGKGYFVIFRLYGPTQPYFDQTWKLSDLEKAQ